MAKTDTTTTATQEADHHDELMQTKVLLDQYWKPLVAAACIVAIGGSAYVIFRTHKRGLAADAAAELGQAQSAQHLEDILASYPETPTAPSAMIRLAKEYYDTLNYAKAQETYEQFLADYPDHLWAPTASLGLAHCREARKEYETALAAYREFATSHVDHFLYAQAILGQMRCLEQQGNLAEAKVVCEDFIAGGDDEVWGAVFETSLEELEMKLKRSQGVL